MTDKNWFAADAEALCRIIEDLRTEGEDCEVMQVSYKGAGLMAVTLVEETLSDGSKVKTLVLHFDK